MPSKSKKQHAMMQAVAHSSDFSKKIGIPQSIGTDFMQADKKAGRYQGGKGKKGKRKDSAGG